MIHGYHVIWGTYGFWLPNDPRGSWSDFVASWALARFGKATKTLERTAVDVSQWACWRAEAVQALRYPAVVLTGNQARIVGQGFANALRKSCYTIWACSILPEHVHLVIGRHPYKVEQIANLLKGEATKRLKQESLHPHARFIGTDGKLPSMWAEHQWKVFFWILRRPSKQRSATSKKTPFEKANVARTGRSSLHLPVSTKAAG
jgi:REP element-mobilizing transposase RayT